MRVGLPTRIHSTPWRASPLTRLAHCGGVFQRTRAESLTALLTIQNSVISNEQAQLAGYSREAWRRLRRNGEWQSLTDGIYLLGLEPPTFRQSLWAGHLMGGAMSATGGLAALHQLGVVPREPSVIEIWVPHGLRRTHRGPWHFRQDRAGRLARRRGTLPVIRPEDAVVDVADGHPLDTFVGLVTDALRINRISLRSITRTIAGRRRLVNRKLWLDTLDDMAGIESTLEFVYRRDVERAHGLPAARRQEGLLAGTRLDLWYDDFATVIELDGRVGHIDGAFRDLDRDNRHAALGQGTARYGSIDVRGRPCAVAAQVAQILRSHGWTGVLCPCPACLVPPLPC